MLTLLLDQVNLQFDVNAEQQSKLFPSSNRNYPLNLGDGWKDQEKIKMLLFLVSLYFNSFFLRNFTFRIISNFFRLKIFIFRLIIT